MAERVVKRPGTKAAKVKAARAEPIIVERRAKAFALRKMGFSYLAIAKKLECSEGTVFNDVHAVLKDLAKQASEDAAEYRAMELERLDAALNAIHAQVKTGHLGAITVWLKIIEKRAKLMGLDMASALEISGPGGGPVPIATISMPVDHL